MNTDYSINVDVRGRKDFLEINKFDPAIIIKGIKNSLLRSNLSKYRITQNKKEVMNLLNKDYLHYYLLSGREGIEKLFYPLLAQVFESNSYTEKEKKELLNNVRLAYDKAIKIADSGIDNSSEVNDGLGYFKSSIDNIVSPYNF